MGWGERIAFVRKVGGTRIARAGLSAWAVLASYDLVLAQLLPDSIAKSMPRAWQVALLAGDLLTWQQWILLLALILTFAALEFAFRRSAVLPAVRVSEGVPKSEFIALCDASRTLYEAARSAGSLLAGAAERMSGNTNGRIAAGSPQDILNFSATHIARHIPIYGKRAPSSVLEQVRDSDVRASYFADGATFLRDTMYDKSVYWTDLAVKSSDFAANFDKMKSLESPQSDPLTDRGNEEFESGYAKITFERNPSRDTALLYLTHMRSKGVRIRNEVPDHFTPSDLNGWVKTVTSWMNDVAGALKSVNEPDSVWFLALDTVPAARVPIPNIRLGGREERDLFVNTFRQHDKRLDRLDGLLHKYGVGIAH
jgi:hypothetical protein